MTKEDLTTFRVLASICFKLKQLHSSYLKLWLKDDFNFPSADMNKMSSMLAKLMKSSVLKLPKNVIDIMCTVLTKYVDKGSVQLSKSGTMAANNKVIISRK